MSVPDSVTSASFTKIDNEHLGLSGLGTALTSLSGFLTKSYYNDADCKTLVLMDGSKLGVCRYDTNSYSYVITTVDQNKITVTEYQDKACSITRQVKPVVEYTDGLCTADLTAYRVSATRDVSTPGFMTRSVYIFFSVNKICS